MAQANITNKKLTMSSKEKLKIDLKKQKIDDEQLVRGRFKFEECPGATLKFSYKKYDKDPVKQYALKDGEIYKLPKGVAKHLAKTGTYAVKEFQKNEFGQSVLKIVKNKRRFTFESLDFFNEIEQKNTTLYEVEKI